MRRSPFSGSWVRSLKCDLTPLDGWEKLWVLTTPRRSPESWITWFFFTYIGVHPSVVSVFSCLRAIHRATSAHTNCGCRSQILCWSKSQQRAACWSGTIYTSFWPHLCIRLNSSTPLVVLSILNALSPDLQTRRHRCLDEIVHKSSFKCCWTTAPPFGGGSWLWSYSRICAVCHVGGIDFSDWMWRILVFCGRIAMSRVHHIGGDISWVTPPVQGYECI